MYDKCFNSLADHATSVFATMTGHKPVLSGVKLDGGSDALPSFTLGERVDFKGEKSDGRKIEGYFICAFKTMAAAKRFASDIAAYLGLTGAKAGTETDSYVGEFLNVVIGLTLSTWADHGFTVEFNPPKKFQEHVVDPKANPGHFFHLLITAEGCYQTSIFVHFFTNV
jgi:CheY-specific phosphatase CheX